MDTVNVKENQSPDGEGKPPSSKRTGSVSDRENVQKTLVEPLAVPAQKFGLERLPADLEGDEFQL